MRGELPQTIVTNENDKPVLPDERFASAAQVRDCCQAMIKADERRAWMRERVDALVNGYPTYPKSVTAAKGFGWFPRVNYRESEGLIAAQQTPLFDLVTEVDHCMEIELDIDASSDEERDDWENAIAKNFTWLLQKRWRKSFNYHIPLEQREMLVHGLGAHVWPDKTKWVPRTPRSGQILFPEACPLNFDEDGKFFMLRDFVPGEDAYGFIRNDKAARNRGWFPDNVWKTLVNAGKQNQRQQPSLQVEDLQRKVRRGDIGYWNTSQTGLWLNWMFVKEYEGGVSLYCIEENISAGNKDGGYLFKKRFMFEGWKDVLVLFPYDIGTGDIHSVRGLGWRTKDFFELSNRVNNAMVAQVLISAFPQVKQNQPNIDPEKLKLMRMGALNLLPYGVEPSMVQFPPLNNTGLALQKHLRETLEGNNQSVVGGTPEPKDRETKYSFMLRSQDAATVSNGQQSLYESNYQQLLETIYRRAIKTPKGDLPYQKMVEEFRERCVADEVPKEALTEKAIASIREVTSTGAGSAALRLQALMTMWENIYPTTTEDRKIAIERDTTAALMGKARVNRYARSVRDNDMPDEDVSLAMQESNGLCNGGEAIVGTRQNDVKHAQNHLQKAAMYVDQLNQGQIDPQHALDALQRLLAHTAEHLARLQRNPIRQAEFKQLVDQFKEIQKVVEQLTQQMQQQQEETPPEQQMSEEGQIGMMKVQQDSQIKQAKAQADMALKARKQMFNERLMDSKTATGIRRDDVKAGTTIRRDDTKAAAGIQRDSVTTAATLAQNAAKTTQKNGEK